MLCVVGIEFCILGITVTNTHSPIHTEIHTHPLYVLGQRWLQVGVCVCVCVCKHVFVLYLQILVSLKLICRHCAVVTVMEEFDQSCLLVALLSCESNVLFFILHYKEYARWKLISQMVILLHHAPIIGPMMLDLVQSWHAMYRLAQSGPDMHASGPDIWARWGPDLVKICMPDQEQPWPR